MPKIRDLLDDVLNKRYVEAQDIFHSIMIDKTKELIDDEREIVARNLFNGNLQADDPDDQQDPSTE